MRSLVRSVFIVLGLPNLIGFVVAASLGTLLLFIRPHVNRTFLLRAADMLSGFVAVFAGVVLARFFNVRPTPWLPLCAAVCFAIYFARSNHLAQFARASIGTLCGWWAYITYAT